jgi:DNA-binding MarR family transcriptional regulator
MPCHGRNRTAAAGVAYSTDRDYRKISDSQWTTELPSEPSETRDALMKRLDRALRTARAQEQLVSQALAEAADLHTTDLDCLNIVQLREPITAGELARLTGLTTGAITGVIDRLERRGLVTRVSDQSDRRRILVRARPENLSRLTEIHRPLREAMDALCAGRAEAELRLLIDFTEGSVAAATEFVRALKTADAGPARPTRRRTQARSGQVAGNSSRHRRTPAPSRKSGPHS